MLPEKDFCLWSSRHHNWKDRGNPNNRNRASCMSTLQWSGHNNTFVTRCIVLLELEWWAKDSLVLLVQLTWAQNSIDTRSTTTSGTTDLSKSTFIVILASICADPRDGRHHRASLLSFSGCSQRNLGLLLLICLLLFLLLTLFVTSPARSLILSEHEREEGTQNQQPHLHPKLFLNCKPLHFWNPVTQPGYWNSETTLFVIPDTLW